VILVFIPNTNELQRFVIAGALDDLARDHELHYVLPSEEADKMRAAAPALRHANISELRVPGERLAIWQQVFQTACAHYADLSPSFALRAKLIPNSGRLQSMSAAERLQHDHQYQTAVEALLDGMKPLQDLVHILDRLDPLYCIIPTSLLDLFCNDVVWACDMRRISCVVLQSGWDNVSSKGILYKGKPFVGCWGPQSARHVKRIQRIPQSITHNLGAPHYEFLRPASSAEVNALRTGLGVAADERLLLFGGSFRQFDETATLQRLETAIATGQFGPVKVVYRPHPWRAARKREDSFFSHQWQHVVLDPDMHDRYVREQAEPGYIKRNVPMFDMVYLSRLLSAADAVISPMSTLLLEAMIMEKPTMAIAFTDGTHYYDPSVTSQMTHFAEAKRSAALVWCDDSERLVADCVTLLAAGTAKRQRAARRKLLADVVTREPGTYAERLAGFCRSTVEAEARKLRGKRVGDRRGTISHAYGADRIARAYCRSATVDQAVPGYWMHGWIPAYHNIHPALIALHKKPGQGTDHDFETQIRAEKEDTQQWVSRADQADYLIAHGYRHVRAIGLPITYLPDPGVRRVPGSLLVMPPHSHKAHGPGDPLAERYASAIADLKPKFDHIKVGLNEDDIAKKQWVDAFRRHGLDIFVTTDQSDPDTLVRLRRILSTFEYVTTNGFGSQIALAAYCGARVSVYGPYAEFPRERMRVTHAVKMFPALLDDAYALCTEDAVRRHYPFLFVEPDKAPVHQAWGAREVGEPFRVSPEELARLFRWSAEPGGGELIEIEQRIRVFASSQPLLREVPGRASITANTMSRTDAHREPRPAARRPLVLFGMAHAGFFRNFEGAIAGLLARGVDVHVHFSKRHHTITMDDYRLPAADANGRLTCSFGEAHRVAPGARESVRLLRDIVLYSRSQYRGAADLRARFSDSQKPSVLPEWLQAFLRTMLGRAPAVLKDVAERLLRRIDESIPPEPSAVALLDAIKPDYVIVTPLVNFASKEVDLVKVARRRRIRTLLAVASWDNLTNKGLIKMCPDHVAVWNTHMAREAMELHGVSPERIWITGATVFDSWFGRQPSRDRETFCRALGLASDAPLIVYLCSSRSIANGEQIVIKEWLRAIRAPNAALESAGVIVRPHPMAAESWAKWTDVDQPSGWSRWRGAVLWPLRPKHPTTPESRADFFDTLYHADAVVGLNTSAMIEAAILGKPVLTFLGHALAGSQTGNLHFRHLADGGGVLYANDMNEHVQQLSAVLERPHGSVEACDRFVADFVRPLGRDVSASATLVAFILGEMGIPAAAPAPSTGAGDGLSSLTGT
jgi:hypothetical protein